MRGWLLSKASSSIIILFLSPLPSTDLLNMHMSSLCTNTNDYRFCLILLKNQCYIRRALFCKMKMLHLYFLKRCCVFMKSAYSHCLPSLSHLSFPILDCSKSSVLRFEYRSVLKVPDSVGCDCYRADLILFPLLR